MTFNRESSPGKEILPHNLESIRFPRIFHEIPHRITRSLMREEPGFSAKPDMCEVHVVDGFEDVLDEPLGAGFWNNTPTTLYQLSSALSISRNPAVTEIFKNERLKPREIVSALREAQALSGMKMIDLGSGRRPHLALAARALGARAYTADAQHIFDSDSERLNDHVVVDFNAPDALAAIQKATGGRFDLVTENIIGTTPSSPRHLQAPDLAKITELGASLLKRGGHLYSSQGRGEFFRKRHSNKF